MENFPREYVEHSLPLILVSGLGAGSELAREPTERSKAFLLEGGFRIKTDAPLLDHQTALGFLDAFKAAGANGRPLSEEGIPPGDRFAGFRIRQIGRVGQAPLLSGCDGSTTLALLGW